MIKFSVARLEKEQITLDGVEPPEFLDLAPDDVVQCCDEVTYHFSVQRVSGGALVRGWCKSAISGICGRCLEPLTQKIDAENIDLFFETEGMEEVDISEDVREELLLEIPMVLLCREDCEGICPVCGANRNTEKCDCADKSGGSLAWNALDNLKL